MSGFSRVSRIRPSSAFRRRPVRFLPVVVDRVAPGRSSRDDGAKEKGESPYMRLLEGCATAFGSILILGLGGYAYHQYYKFLVLEKIENAFAPGFSTLELAALGQRAGENPNAPEAHHDWVPRDEQPTIDAILDGTAVGRYHLLTGEKGTGKTSMLLKAMQKIGGDGVAMLEAHGDLEIFRERLGKAIDYEFHEDYIGSLFAFQGPRSTTPLLDIERAFNKMEKIALRRFERLGKPLVLVINGAHLIRDNEDGQHLLELIQQRAELWAASSLVTVVLNADQYWITERLMSNATRLSVMSVRDIPRLKATAALKSFRQRVFGEDVPDSVLAQVYAKVGGRLRFLDEVARAPDMLRRCQTIIDKEERWFLSQCWIFGGDMDDAAEEQQDFCNAAMILAKVLLEREADQSDEHSGYSNLPRIPLHKARELMTRADFIQQHDYLNIFSIDSEGMVQADSVPMQNVFRKICSQPGFEEHLKATQERLDDLESLGRTRELTMKEDSARQRIVCSKE